MIYDLPQQNLIHQQTAQKAVFPAGWIPNVTPPLKQGHKRCSKEGPERREKKSVEFGDVLQVIYNGIGQHRLNKLTSFGLMNILYIYYVWWRQGSRVWTASHKLCSTLSLIRKIFKPLLSIIAVIEFPQNIYVYIHSVLLNEQMNWSKTYCYCLWWLLLFLIFHQVVPWCPSWCRSFRPTTGAGYNTVTAGRDGRIEELSIL